VVAAHRVEVALPPQLAASGAEPLLLLEAQQQLESPLDRFALGGDARGAHCALHQLIVDHDVGSHQRLSNVYSMTPYYTSQEKDFAIDEGIALLVALRRATDGPRTVDRSARHYAYACGDLINYALLHARLS
jgi:hypothetical protein